jgi:hypothetical protein
VVVIGGGIVRLKLSEPPDSIGRMFDKAVVAELAGLVDRLAELPSAAGDDATRIDVIAGLEKLKAAAYAAQLRVIADFAASQEAANKAMGIEARQAQRGIPEQIGWARKVSPASAARQLGQARALIDQMPDTYGLLLQGEISEHVATIVTTETSHLAVEDRRLVDKKLADQLPRLSPKRAHAATRRLAIEADPAGAVRRAGNAREDRRVSSRPAPDTMAVLSALLPCEQGVAAYAALRRHSEAAVAAGDDRTLNQIMADTLVERLTGQATADAVSAEIGLVMTDAALFAGDDTAADLTGYGPIPADLAREIARGAGDGAAQPGEAETRAAARARIFLRRLFTEPVTGVIENCDPRRRRFDGVLARLLVYRDQQCRDPFCDAPIRHLDHIEAFAAGGPTICENGRSVCQRGNYARQMPGFSVRLIDPTRHVVEVSTPTGHRYRSSAPTSPGANRRPPLRQSYPRRT